MAAVFRVSGPSSDSSMLSRTDVPRTIEAPCSRTAITARSLVPEHFNVPENFNFSYSTV
ncbi:unnamed protein product, partial [Nesidiocoris tenuis]